MNENDPLSNEPGGRRGLPARLSDALAAAFDVAPTDRTSTVTRILSRSGRRAAAYWFQLLLACGIATLGLVLDSTAVVIGAMLVSPLMGPIVELGMGLALGSPFLVIRSFTRTAVSVFVVAATATLLTLALPFHEVTHEIAARTSPTVLDLGVASFCALAATFAVIRPGSDTAATAAGTAIGIALVPPICVIGYGFGTASLHVSAGASLLFTANFCAIVLFAALSFFVLGYGRVDYRSLEDAELERSGARSLTARAARRLRPLFASRYGPVLRVAMPLLFSVSVYVPLRRALAEVTWELAVRAEIQRALAAVPEPSFHSTVHVEGHRIAVSLVTVGAEVDSNRLEHELSDRIERVAGVPPTVRVRAVPDDAALRRLQATLAATPPEPMPAPAYPDVALLRGTSATALAELWPRTQAGPLLQARLDLLGAAPVIEVIHLGPPLGVAGEDLLGRALSSKLGTAISVRDRPLPDQPVVAELDAGTGWLPAAGEALGMLGAEPELVACVEAPSTASHGGRDVERVVQALRAAPGFDPARVHMAQGPRWSVQLSTSACAETIRDAGVDSAADAADE